MSALMQRVQLGNRGVGLADILSAARFVGIKLRNSLSMVNLVSFKIRKSVGNTGNSDAKDWRYYGRSWDGEQVSVEFVQVVVTRAGIFVSKRA